MDLAGAKERLHLFKADLLIDGSFDSVLTGCHGVFHTASPCFVECSDPQVGWLLHSELYYDDKINRNATCCIHILNFIHCIQAELIEPAVKGTLNVLRACVKVSSVKRVVITSSIASVLFSGKPLTSDVVVDETWYSDPVVCKDSKVLLITTILATCPIHFISHSIGKT